MRLRERLPLKFPLSRPFSWYPVASKAGGTDVKQVTEYVGISGRGFGIRSIMDVWVYNKHYRNILDRSYIETELTKAGLMKFAQAVAVRKLGCGMVWRKRYERA